MQDEELDEGVDRSVNDELRRWFYRPVNFGNLYVQTILTEFFGLGLGRPHFFIFAVVIYVFWGIIRGFGEGVGLFDDVFATLAALPDLMIGAGVRFLLVYLLVMLIPCRRIVASILTLITRSGNDAEIAYQLGAREPTREEYRICQ